jgi:hypothetical protein
LSEEECRAVRSEAFEIVNKAHTCNDDTECAPTNWPGCARPSSSKALAKIEPLHKKFTEGQCKDPDARACPETPVVYCKQGLCVFRHRAGEAGNPDAAGSAGPAKGEPAKK